MLSATVMCGNRAYSWNTSPMFRLCGGSSEMFRPSILIEPEVGRTNPATERSVVVLPQPDGPRSATHSPSATSRDRSGITRTGP